MLFIQVRVDRFRLNRTIRKLQSLPPRVGRKALRKGVTKAGKESLKDVRMVAPRGRTGQFKRSMAQKNITYAAKSIYQSLVGGRKNKQRSMAARYRPSTRNNGNLSRGLSGQGLAPSVWWMDKGVKAHTIKPKNRRKLAWNIVAGGKRLRNPLFARAVRHPGHKGTGFMTRLIKRGEPKRLKIVREEVVAEVRRLGYSI
jgi:hypothetical protein